jgi:hypothetical protein
MAEPAQTRLPPGSNQYVAPEDLSVRAGGLQGLAGWICERPRLIFAILALVLAIQITPNFKLNPDGIGYMSLARNLALHGQWLHLGSAHIHYAPGYSLVIAPAFWLLSRPFVLIQLIHLALCVVLMFATYRWFARYDRAGATFVTAFVLVNVGFWDLFRQPTAEMAFMPLVMVAAVLMNAALDSKSPAKFWQATFGATLVVMAACLVRQNGVFLAAGFALAILGRILTNKDRTSNGAQITWPRVVAASGLVAFGALAVVATLVIVDKRQAALEQEGSFTYTSFLHQPGLGPGARILEGVRRQTAEIGRLVIPGMWKTYARAGEWLDINTLAYLVVCIPVFVGWISLLRQRLDPLLLTFPFYFAFCVYYPFDSGTRFTVPMLPVIAACLWASMRPLGHRRGWIFLILVFAHLIVSIGFWIPDRLRVNHWYQAEPTMRDVVAALPEDRRGMATLDVPDEDYYFLVLFSDRRVWPLDPGDWIPASVTLIVTRETDPLIPGFKTLRTIDGLRIERRNGS